MSESEHSSQVSESGISQGSDSESSSDIMAYSFEPSGTDSGSSSEASSDGSDDRLSDTSSHNYYAENLLLCSDAELFLFRLAGFSNYVGRALGLKRTFLFNPIAFAYQWIDEVLTNIVVSFSLPSNQPQSNHNNNYR